MTGMTEGSCFRQLIRFSVPLLLGNIFQQLYNIVDSIVVGNFVGSSALAAVGSSAAVINMVLSFFVGMSVGAGIVISQYFGAKRFEELKETVQTTIAFAVLAGIAVTAIGLLFTVHILKWMDTPQNVMENSVLYFRIFFLGGIPLTLYNMGSGILKALGESKKPLLYLIISSLCNVVLDVIFVVVLGGGIAGVAAATVIAEIVSAILIWIEIQKLECGCPNGLKDIKIVPGKCCEILRYGVPTGLQNMIVSFSNMIVQTRINYFDTAAVAGCGAYEKLYSFVNLPINTIAMAETTFISQNKGAGKDKRVCRGFGISLGTACCYASVSGILICLLAPILLKLFSSDHLVLEYGTMMARTLAPFYLVVAASHVLNGYLRGIGKVGFATGVSIFCWCVVRIGWLTVLVPITGRITTVFYSYPVTWGLSVIIYGGYLFCKRKKKLAEYATIKRDFS